MATNEQDPWQPIDLPEKPQADETPEATKNIYDITMEKLGFVEDEQLRELRRQITELIRQTPEPTVPDDPYEDIDFPSEVVSLMGQYQDLAHTIINEIPKDNSDIRAQHQIALYLNSGRMTYEGGWNNVFRQNNYIEDAADYSRNMTVQFPAVFEELAKSTQHPYHP